MQRVVDWIINHWSLSAFILAIFVQFTPAIKFNPFTLLFTWIGRIMANAITADLRKDVAELKRISTEQQETIDENEKDRIRWEVLDFANSCRNGRRHTKDEFQHIITLNGKYKALLKKTNDENGVFDAEYEYIRDLYRERQEKNDFL